MCGSLVRARRASISSAGRQWACMSIMAVLLGLSSNGFTDQSRKSSVRGYFPTVVQSIATGTANQALSRTLLLGWGLALKYRGCGSGHGMQSRRSVKSFVDNFFSATTYVCATRLGRLGNLSFTSFSYAVFFLKNGRSCMRLKCDTTLWND